MIIVITSDGDKRHALRRLISPFSSNIRCQLGKNNFEKSSTSQYVSTNLFMLVPFCSNHSWSNDRIMERAFSSFKLVISYPKLRLINYSALNTSSVLAAQIKSFLCKPLIEWLHQVTVTLPHSVNRPG